MAAWLGWFPTFPFPIPQIRLPSAFLGAKCEYWSGRGKEGADSSAVKDSEGGGWDTGRDTGKTELEVLMSQPGEFPGNPLYSYEPFFTGQSCKIREYLRVFNLVLAVPTLNWSCFPSPFPPGQFRLPALSRSSCSSSRAVTLQSRDGDSTELPAAAATGGDPRLLGRCKGVKSKQFLQQSCSHDIL